jgi:hypothetical protein
MKEDTNKIIKGLSKDDEHTLAEDLYALGLVRQYFEDKKAGKIKSQTAEDFLKEYGL